MPLCRHPALEQPHSPAEMVPLGKGRHWVCRDCGAVLLNEDVEEMARTPSPGLVAELEAIIKDTLERAD